MMDRLDERDLAKLRESVVCNFCGGEKQTLCYQIDSQSRQLKTLWLNDIEYAIHSQESIVRCTTCDLVYVNPRLAANAALETYDDSAEAHYFTSTRPSRMRAYAHVIETLPTWLGYRPETLLDIGCGDGLLLELGLAAGIDCFGTEQRNSLCEQVRARLGNQSIVAADVSQLAAASYDVVSLLNVIEHLHHPKEMLMSIHRVLKPGGILLVHAPNLNGVSARLRGKNWNQVEPFEHFYYFNAQTLSAMLSKTGFEVIGRFSLFTASGIKDKLQRFLAQNQLYIDNGLGIVSRRID